MPGDESGILGGACGGVVPGPLGVGGQVVTENGPVGLRTPLAYVPLARPQNASRWDLRRYGKAEIGFYCDNYTPNDRTSVTEIRRIMGRNNASACVLIGYEVSFPLPNQRSNVFQAYCRFTISGPFLPLEVKNKTAQRRAKPAYMQPPPADDPRMWEKALARLLKHEVGHIDRAWDDRSFVDADFERSFSNNDSLTYEEFQQVVRGSQNSMLGSGLVLESGAKQHDDADMDNTTQEIKDLWIYMPIKKPGEPLD